MPDPEPEIRWGGGVGGRSSRPLDKGRGGAVWKKFFRPFGPQFDPKIGGGPGPPGPSPGPATVVDLDTGSIKTNKHPRPNFATHLFFISPVYYSHPKKN